MALLEDSAHNGGRLGKLDHQLAQEQHYLDDGSDGGFYSSIHSRNKYNRRVIDGAGARSYNSRSPLGPIIAV